MRVLFLHDRIRTGGSERNMIDLMIALRALGVEPYLCLMADAGAGSLCARLEASEIPTVILGSSRLYDPRAAVRFASFLAKRDFDLVHLEDPYPAFLAVIARYLFAVPVVVTSHVLALAYRTPRERLRARLLDAAVRMASDRAIVLAEPLRHPFSDRAGINPDRVVVVPNGLEPWPDPGCRRRELRRREGWAPDCDVILMVAVLRPGKGHADLLTALPAILARRPAARLKIVGDGELRPQLHALAARYGAAVELLGERSDIAELMAAADLLVLPSESEAFPTVLLEAAMAGLPAVATDVGGTSTILEHGVTGLLIPPGMPDALSAAIVKILADPGLARALGAAGRRKALTQFTVAHQAAATLAVYQTLIGADAGRSRTRSALGKRLRIDSAGLP